MALPHRDPRADRPLSWLRKLSNNGRIWRLLLCLYILYRVIVLVPQYVGIVALPFDSTPPLLSTSDFPAFYGGAKLFLEHPSLAYNVPAQQEAIHGAKREPDDDNPWTRYYNPPVYSLLLAPLTLLDVRSAYILTLLINLGGLYLLLRVLFAICPRRDVAWPLAAFTVTSIPVNYAFWHAQPTLFLAAAFGLAWLHLEDGGGRRSGAYWALLLIKPQWALSAGLGLLRRSLRPLPAFLLIGTLMGLPFLIVGPHATLDFVRLLLGRAAGDVDDVSFAEAVLSWSGFFRALTGQAEPVAWVAMSLITLGLMGAVVRQGQHDLLPLATVLGSLLVVPHSHPQDWIMVVPAAAFLLRSQQTRPGFAVTAALLLGIYIGLADWSGLAGKTHALYWPTLMAFLLLVWVTLLSLYESQARQGGAVMVSSTPRLATQPLPVDAALSRRIAGDGS